MILTFRRSVSVVVSQDAVVQIWEGCLVEVAGVVELLEHLLPGHLYGQIHPEKQWVISEGRRALSFL